MRLSAASVRMGANQFTREISASFLLPPRSQLCHKKLKVGLYNEVIEGRASNVHMANSLQGKMTLL
jgi:hypothetical protein